MVFFVVDEDMEKIIEVWFEKGKVVKVLEFWVKGFLLNWDVLY